MKLIAKKLKALYKNGFFHVFFGGTLSKMVAFFSSIAIVRLISKTDYANLAYVDNLYNYLILFSGFGMTSAVLKFAISENKAKNNGYYLFSIKLGTAFQAILILILVIIISNTNTSFIIAKQLTYLLIPYGLFIFWISLFQSFLRTNFENKKYSLSSFFQVFFTFIFSIYGVSKWGVKSIPFARALAMIFAFIFFAKYVSSEMKNNGAERLDFAEKKEFLGLSGALLISNVFSMIMPANEVFLINNLIQNETITANYKVANLIPSQLPFITSTIVIFYFPIIAKSINPSSQWKKIKKIGLITFFINLILTVVGIVLTPTVIKIVYGEAYKDINMLSLVLWIAYFFNAGFRMLPMNLLPAIGYSRFNVIISVISCIIHFVLDYHFIKNFGVNGAVFTIGLIYIITGILYWTYLYIKCKGDLR